MQLYMNIAILLCLGRANFGSVRAGGWLDRAVKNQLRIFEEDVKRVLPPIEIEVIVAPKPAGFVDSPLWTEEAALRLISLLEESNATPPRLRRMLEDEFDGLMTRRAGPKRKRTLTRREFEKAVHANEAIITRELAQHATDAEILEVIKVKPIIRIRIEDFLIENNLKLSQAIVGMKEGKEQIIDLFYDCGDEDDDEVDDADVIVIANPVESQLPSARISIRLLKSILRQRAQVARYKPPSTTPEAAETTASGVSESTQTQNDTTSTTTLTTDTSPTTTMAAPPVT